MNIKFPDGSMRQYEDGATAYDIAQSISPKLKKSTLAAELDGELFDASRPIYGDHTIKLLTFADDGGKWTYRHTAAHIMAQAVKHLFPEVKLAIGPAIDNGFYYDFDTEISFSSEDFDRIEQEIAKIIAQDLPLERFELPREEALEFMRRQEEPYKVELINDLPEDSVISFYRQGDFVDLCAGPHLPSTGRAKNIKLMSVAGAYWRGSEKNKMLKRIYATAFEKKSELDEYIHKLEEAKKRDNRKLGKELGLFVTLDEGPGFPFFLPKGMAVRNELTKYWREIHTRHGYKEISTPIMLTRQLWETSGHWEHYKDNMYTTVIDDTDFAIKPMNCPGGVLVYRNEMHSYRDLPLRLGELGLVHRHEMSGALHGLMRVRCFTQDDAHIFMTQEQIKSEIKGVAALIDEVYTQFGFKYSIELSTMPEDHIGTIEAWELATDALREALNEMGREYVINEGDGAFYGPKIDFHLEDCLGRTWQCGTIQLDFQLPERFDLTYVGADGEKHRPIMIHRVVFGSMERFMGILIEQFAGAFPTWLAPVQVKVLAMTDRTHDAALDLANKLEAMGVRTETDLRNEKIGFKIREAQMMKIPYMLIVGDKEVENEVVAVRSRKKGDIGTMSFDAFAKMIINEITMREKD